MIPFTTSLCWPPKAPRTGAPKDWSSQQALAHAQPPSAQATADSQTMFRPNSLIKRNSQGILEIRIRRDVPFAAPRDEAPLALASVAEEKLHAQHSLVEELEHAGVGRAVISGRFFSLHKNYQRRRSRFKFCRPENGVLVDETYQGPASCLLQHVANWNFNTFTLDHLTNGRALFHLGVHLFEDYGLVEHFHLDHLKLMKCFGLLEASYHSTNPFHNSVHAADVTQALHCVLQQSQIRRALSKMEMMGALLAAAGHDVDHPGVNQPFLVGTRNYLAALYNNKSVLENHHWRTSICLIRQSGLLDHLPPEQQKELEEIMKTMILATDITRQPDLIARFKQLNETKTPAEILADRGDRLFVMQIVLKCADINNPCRPWAISRIWSQRCVHEFFKQGDRERRLNLPVTAICDRKTNNLPRIQVGFIEYVVAPLFREWHRFNDGELASTMLRNLETNLVKWQALAKEYAERQGAEDAGAQMAPTAAPLKPPTVQIATPQPEDIKGWTAELPVATLPLFRSISRRSIVPPSAKRRHSLPPSLHDKRPRTSLHREQFTADPRSRRHSIFSETLMRFSTSGDPFVDRVSFSVEPSYRPPELPGPSWSTEDIAPRMSRITSLTCDTEVSRISTAVTADTDSEGDSEIGPVFAREEGGRARRLRGRMSQSFDEESMHEPFVPTEEEEEEGEGGEEGDKENSDGGPREATLYYDWNARGPKYFERKIKEEEEQVELAAGDDDLPPPPSRRHSKPPPHPGMDASSCAAVLGKRRSIPPFLCMFPGHLAGGMSAERLVLRRRSEPITPPFHFQLGGREEEETETETDEPPPKTVFQRRRGSEPVDVLSTSQRVFLEGLQHSVSSSSVSGLERASSRASDTQERERRQQRRSGNSSPGGGPAPGGSAGGMSAIYLDPCDYTRLYILA